MPTTRSATVSNMISPTHEGLDGTPFGIFLMEFGSPDAGVISISTAAGFVIECNILHRVVRNWGKFNRNPLWVYGTSVGHYGSRYQQHPRPRTKSSDFHDVVNIQNGFSHSEIQSKECLIHNLTIHFDVGIYTGVQVRLPTEIAPQHYPEPPVLNRRLSKT